MNFSSTVYSMETRAIMAVYDLRAINRKYSIQYIFLFQNYRKPLRFWSIYTSHFSKNAFYVSRNVLQTQS